MDRFRKGAMMSHNCLKLIRLGQARLLLGMVILLAGQPGFSAEIRMRIDADEPVGECHNFWSVKNFTWQDIFDNPVGMDQFRRNHPYVTHVNCIRFMGGRGDGKNRWLLEVGKDGRLVTDFTEMIVYVRGILEWGYEPMIVLDNVPLALSEPHELHKYGNTYPPKDYDAYHRFIELLVESLVEHFGQDTVAGWRFRVMTEPDLYPGHWAATKEEYLKLYDYAVDAVTRVIPNADIGPGNILNPVRHAKWGLDIIDHCAVGTNHYTGRVGTRMTNFSSSWYGRVGEPESTLAEVVKLIRERLGKYESLRDTPVEIAEFAVLFDADRNRFFCGEGTEWSASWLASVAAMAWDLDIHRIHQWATTSAIDTAPDAPNFEAVRALMPEGMHVPYTHVLTMLEAMAGGTRLGVHIPDSDWKESPGLGAVACLKNGEVFLLVFNHQPGMEKDKPIDLRLTVDLPAKSSTGSWTVSEWLIDERHSGFTRALQADCEAAGLQPIAEKAPIFPANISERFGPAGVEVWLENLGKYQALSRLHSVREQEPVSIKGNKLDLRLTMPTHSVRFLRLKPSSVN